MIEDIHAATCHSVRRICEVLGVPRSSYYHGSEPTGTQVAEYGSGEYR